MTRRRTAHGARGPCKTPLHGCSNATIVRGHLAQQHMEPVATAMQDTAVATNIKSVSWVQRFRKRWALKHGGFMSVERLARAVIGER